MAFVIGTTSRGRTLVLSPEERSRHVHILGASGSGKSKEMEWMLRQDILAGRGLCLLDPHGTLADALVEFCASRRVHRRVHVLEPAEAGWAFGFNPLRLDGRTEPAARVDAMVNACAQVWGGEDTSSTPLLKKCLRCVFYALLYRGLTLLEAVELVSSTDPRAIRRALTDGLPDYVFDSVWRDFNRLSRREFAEQFSSTNNRLMEFLSSPVIRRIVGQREHALDLRQIMDNDEILIVNLAHKGWISPDNTRLIGTLLTSELFLLACARDAKTAKLHPFYLYIDECYKFLTSDIESMLDETRKFGLHVVLGHQRLGQLTKHGEAIYNGVMAGAQTKVVFGGLEDNDAEVMARHVFRDSFNLERPKHVLDKPIVKDEVPYWMENESGSETETRNYGITRSSADTENAGTAASEGEQYAVLPDGSVEPRGLTLSGATFAGSATTTALAMSEAYGTASTRGWGRAQTLKPVRVMMPTAVYSLEEELHRAIVTLRGLPKRSAIFKRVGRPAIRLRAIEVNPPLVRKDDVGRFLQTVRTTSPYLASVLAVDAEIEARQATMLHLVVQDVASGETSFWHPTE